MFFRYDLGIRNHRGQQQHQQQQQQAYQLPPSSPFPPAPTPSSFQQHYASFPASPSLSHDQSDFRAELKLKKDNRHPDPDKYLLWCPIKGLYWAAQMVVAGHLFPWKSGQIEITGSWLGDQDPVVASSELSSSECVGVSKPGPEEWEYGFLLWFLLDRVAKYSHYHAIVLSFVSSHSITFP